jgi:hypothetical protein
MRRFLLIKADTMIRQYLLLKIKMIFFDNFKLDIIPNDPKGLFTLLNSPDIYKDTKGILTGMLISKRVLRKVKNSALISLMTLERELKYKEG